MEYKGYYITLDIYQVDNDSDRSWNVGSYTIEKISDSECKSKEYLHDQEYANSKSEATSKTISLAKQTIDKIL